MRSPYPYLSSHRPPRGRFSHLAMFRIGTIMYIPAYLTVVLYRPLASVNKDTSNPVLMFGMYHYVFCNHADLCLPTLALALSTYVA